MRKERPTQKEMQRLAGDIAIAKEAFEKEMTDGKISGKEFVVFTGEASEILARWSAGLNKHVDFVVTYQEGMHFKHTIIKNVNDEQITVTEPELELDLSIPFNKFRQNWRQTNFWLMMIRK